MGVIREFYYSCIRDYIEIISEFVSNNYFQFKQFTIHQERCAMKVCTDACLFGAYIARELFGRQLAPGNILDIGTGTGLLSLMVAQKTNGIIDAIEIDGAAAQQAKQNFEQSPWNNRLNIFKTDALLFNPGKKYDCIISNPPFFEGDLKSGNKKRNAAKHDTTFTLEQLLSVIGRHLLPHGFFGILLPCQRVNLFVEIATAAHYFLNGQLLIQHTGGHQFFRGILFFSHHNTTIIRNELAIKDENGNYTHNFIELLEDYYLNL